MTNTNGIKLSERAMLVNLSISQWTARKCDKRVTSDAIAANGAERDAGRFNKLLLHGDALQAVTKHVNFVRGRHYLLTMPWADTGWRMISVHAFFDYTEEMARHEATFNRLVSRLATSYAEMREEARRHLGAMYREEDYPPTLQTRFGFALSFSPIADDTQDIRVALPDSAIEAIAASISSRAESAMRCAVRDAWERVHECVKHMADKLGDKDAIFRDSLIDNIRELAEVLPGLNVTDDPGLAAMAKDLMGRLARNDADDLRNDPGLRKRTAAEAARMLADIDRALGSLA